MKKELEFELQCESCHQNFKAKSLIFLDVTGNLELKTQVAEGDIFKHSCPHCQTHHYVLTPLAYLDGDQKVFLQLMDLTEDFDMEDLVSENITYRRKTDTYEEFVEKLEIIKDHYHDKLIELLKSAILKQAAQTQNPNLWPITNISYLSQGKQCRLGMKKDDLIRFVVQVQNKDQQLIELSANHYQHLADQHPELLEEDGRLLKVDIQWAIDYLSQSTTQA